VLLVVSYVLSFVADAGPLLPTLPPWPELPPWPDLSPLWHVVEILGYGFLFVLVIAALAAIFGRGKVAEGGRYVLNAILDLLKAIVAVIGQWLSGKRKRRRGGCDHCCDADQDGHGLADRDDQAGRS
jgi:hypothetical protein